MTHVKQLTQRNASLARSNADLRQKLRQAAQLAQQEAAVSKTEFTNENLAPTQPGSGPESGCGPTTKFHSPNVPLDRRQKTRFADTPLAAAAAAAAAEEAATREATEAEIARMRQQGGNGTSESPYENMNTCTWSSGNELSCSEPMFGEQEQSSINGEGNRENEFRDLERRSRFVTTWPSMLTKFNAFFLYPILRCEPNCLLTIRGRFVLKLISVGSTTSSK